jgi:hypothetical protein
MAKSPATEPTQSLTLLLVSLLLSAVLGGLHGLTLPRLLGVATIVAAPEGAGEVETKEELSGEFVVTGGEDVMLGGRADVAHAALQGAREEDRTGAACPERQVYRLERLGDRLCPGQPEQTVLLLAEAFPAADYVPRLFQGPVHEGLSGPE